MGGSAERHMETPCVNVCRIVSESGLCEGCVPEIEAIASWASLSPAERRRIMAELPARRRAAAIARQKG